MSVKTGRQLILVVVLGAILPATARANPWNGKVVLQAFWWDCWNENYPFDWYTYLAKLSPRLKELGFDGVWVPAPSKGNAGGNSMGYDPFDHYDLGDKDQKGRTGTRFGDKDSLLRFIAVAHANGLEVYPDIVLNHSVGGQEDPNAPGDRFKKFRYVAFAGTDRGRWAKDWWNFHPNPDHQCTLGDICQQSFGPDICYLDAEHGGGGNGKYMRDQARDWFVWLTKQTGADGFRFDAVKGFEAYVVEDLLYNAMGDRIDYFAVGEYVSGISDVDNWCALTKNRAGTFDFTYREALLGIVDAGGFFDMGTLPNYQQKNRIKTVPFVNSHDTWRGAFWDSNSNGSITHDDRFDDWRKNGDELAPTLDPDNPRADLAYAAAFAVDGSPMVYYEDLFINDGPDRFKADPKAIKTRRFVENLVWCHQKLNFKDGPYKVRFQGSPDLLVIERGGKALIGLNDHGGKTLSAWVPTDFGPHVRLHDYSGSNQDDVETNNDGWVQLSVPAMSYAVWGPVGIGGGFQPPNRRTTQEFQLDNDLGDGRSSALGYGGKLSADAFRTAGSIWPAAGSVVKVWVYTDGPRKVELQVFRPAADGSKSRADSSCSKTGETSNTAPLTYEFTADREGYHQLLAKIGGGDTTPTRAYVKVEYEAPATSDKF